MASATLQETVTQTDPATVPVRVVRLERNPPHGLGITVVGMGRRQGDSNPRGNSMGNFIGHIEPGSPAALSGKLLVGDELHAIDGEAVRHLPHDDCLDRFRQSSTPGSPVKQSILLVVAQNPAGWKVFCESTKETDLAALHINPRGEPAIVHPRDPVGGPTHGIGGSFGKGVQSVVDVHRFTVTESADEVDGSLTAGIAAFRAGKIEEAEQYFLNALHTVLDPSIQSAIVNASLLPMDEAREECRRIVALEQQRKGGVHYLLGLSLLYQDKWPEAAASLLTAANQTVSWLCLDGMKVDAADPSFHHSIGTSLTDVGKIDVAMIALEEALTRAPRQTQWLVELNAVRRRQGLVSVQLGATFPRVRTSLPRITPPCNAVLATTPSESTEEKQRPSSTHSATAGHAITPTTSPDDEHRSVEVDSVATADIAQSPDSTASPDDFRPNGETTEDTSMPEVAGVSPETASHTVEAETG